MRRFSPGQALETTQVLQNPWRARTEGLLAVLLTAIVLLVSACNQASATTPGGTSTTTHQATPTRANSTSDALPAFSDWRASYLGSDGHLHVITFDGKTDLTGPELPNLSSPAFSVFASAGVAQSGHVLAYDTAGLTTILDVGTQPMVTHTVNLTAIEMAWSPDGSELAASDGVFSAYTVSANGGQPYQIPVQPLPQGWQKSTSLLGWIDSTHVAVSMVPTGPVYTAPDGSTYVTAVGLGALDVTSGQLSVVATISFPGFGNPTFVLSSDGKTVLFYNSQFRGNPFTPDVEVIDTHSGAREPLTGITQATHAGFTAVAWQPGTQTIAVTDGNAQSWLLDTRQDSATQLLPGQYVAGWAPNQGPLIVTTADQSEKVGTGPFVISAVTLAPSGQISTTLLTHAAWTFPFVGFVRTAT